MNAQLLRRALGYAQSPVGRRTVDEALGRLRLVAVRSSGGAQLLGKVDTPRNRQRLKQLLQKRSRRR